MTLDLNEFKEQIPSMKVIIQNNQNLPLTDLVSKCSAACGVPVVTSIYYIGSIIGFSDELDRVLNICLQFYKYDAIVGVEEYRK